MRTLLIPILSLLLLSSGHAQEAVIDLHAPAYAGQAAVLYRTLDLFTLRAERVTSALIGDDGRSELRTEAKGTQRLLIRIGDVFGDLYARPGSRYAVEFHPPEGRARSLNGTTRAELLFIDLDPLDPNALTADLNARIDAFISEDLATDQAAGMQALDVVRRSEEQGDSLKRPPTLFVMPTWSKARVDTFEQKVRHFYRDVNDPWFAHYLDNSFAGLRHGPRVNEKEIFDSCIKGKPIAYDDPEQVRFLRSFYSEQLQQAQRADGATLKKAFDLGDPDTLSALLAKSDFLKDDARLRELVMIDLLYQQYHSKVVDREGAEAILREVSQHSTFPEHRSIAANMLWDLTAMRVGEPLPAIRVEHPNGKEATLDSLLTGAACVMLTASWCSYCEQELEGLAQLQAEYTDVVRFVVISLDHDAETLRRYLKTHKETGFVWLRAQAEQQLRDDLRVRHLPAFYLLNDGVLARSPAPAPSRGLGALLHAVKAEAEQNGRVKVWDD